MYWRHFKILLTLLLAVLLMAPMAQAKNVTTGSKSGPPADTNMPDELFELNGKVNKKTVREAKDFIYIQIQSNTPEICWIPVDVDTELYTLRNDEDDGLYILDWGPDWYVPSTCLADSWVCGVDQPAVLGPFEVGWFDCTYVKDSEGNSVFDSMSVLSNDYTLPEVYQTYIPLMSDIDRSGMEDGKYHVLGRSGGSEIVWLDGPVQVNCTGEGDSRQCDNHTLCWNRLNEAGSSIVWETAEIYSGEIDADTAAWWRGEAPPYALVDELNCNINE